MMKVLKQCGLLLGLVVGTAGLVLSLHGQANHLLLNRSVK